MPFARRPSLVLALIISTFVSLPARGLVPGPSLQKETGQKGEPRPGIRFWLITAPMPMPVSYRP